MSSENSRPNPQTNSNLFKSDIKTKEENETPKDEQNLPKSRGNSEV